MLVANTHSPASGSFQGSATPRVIEHPPKMKPLLMRGGQEEVDGGRTTRDVSPETIANAVMVLLKRTQLKLGLYIPAIIFIAAAL